MPHALIRTRVAQPLGQIARESMALVESAQGQKAGVTADLPAGKIHANGFGAVEEEGELCYTRCHVADASKGNAWVLLKSSVHQPFRASFLFSPEKS